jgi:hypothetical protein
MGAIRDARGKRGVPGERCFRPGYDGSNVVNPDS